jgi:hypothetical protein
MSRILSAVLTIIFRIEFPFHYAMETGSESFAIGKRVCGADRYSKIEWVLPILIEKWKQAVTSKRCHYPWKNVGARGNEEIRSPGVLLVRLATDIRFSLQALEINTVCFHGMQ